MFGRPSQFPDESIYQPISALELSFRSCATCLAGHQQSYNTCWRPGGTTGTPFATNDVATTFFDVLRLAFAARHLHLRGFAFRTCETFWTGMHSALSRLSFMIIMISPVQSLPPLFSKFLQYGASRQPHSDPFRSIQIIRKELVRHALEEAELEKPDVSSSMIFIF